MRGVDVIASPGPAMAKRPAWITPMRRQGSVLGGLPGPYTARPDDEDKRPWILRGRLVEELLNPGFLQMRASSLRPLDGDYPSISSRMRFTVCLSRGRSFSMTFHTSSRSTPM